MIQMEALNNCILLALLGIVVVVSGEATYNGDTFLRTYPKTQSDRDFLNGIGASDISQYANMWGIPALDGLPVYIYVKVGGFDVTKAAFDKQNLAFETLIEDWQKLIDQEKFDIQQQREQHDSTDYDFETYHTFEEVVTFLKEEEEGNPAQINVTSLGKTYEGRDILLTKVSKSGSSGDKPIIYVNCAIHAREWITTAVCNWMIRQLTSSKDSALLEKYDWWFVPIANPDGYVYSWTQVIDLFF